MPDDEFRFCWVACASADEARAIARATVGERLAACANLLGPSESLYWWKGRLEAAAEHALVLKTRAALVPALVARVRALHSYEVPCIVALPIAGGDPGYLAWLAAETSPPPP
jgi:periplasmic divalent cation tolerance protein